ncbi:MAG: hypothetical protein COB30_015915 [Ectothiorhodospiraceae bacterium]|nr:hypothetical protein [Ectothiorhodospiraceae bacterium]
MTPDQKCEFWQKHINAWQQSKLSQKHYCQQHDLRVANFGYWRTRLKGGAQKQGSGLSLPHFEMAISLWSLTWTYMGTAKS